MVMKHHLTPLTKGGTRTVHAGKGSTQAPMAARDVVTRPPGAPPAGMNDYAKTTPMATTAPATAPRFGAGIQSLGGAPSGGIG